MKEDENIEAYFLRVAKDVNTIRRLGKQMKEYMFVQKVPR